jgi:hypothetical protein
VVLAQQVHKESKVMWGRPVLLVVLAQQAHKESKVMWGRPVLLVEPVHKEFKVI